MSKDKPPFDKILIANRGEIACRIIRTIRKLWRGTKVVAVYSDADNNSLHVRMADEAVHIGPPPADKSYLSIEDILEAARRTGAKAVHPGYGFLSENYAFAKALEDEGIVFIGPSSDAIKQMGDKIAAKKIAQKSGVSTIPGGAGAVKDAKEAVKLAKDIGYPVMVKAAAGGGGKGMRIVHNKKEMDQAFESAVNEARKSFKDPRILIEKYIEQPRHIEIQVLADQHGNIVCLGERECSIQRHHQKVIEEAPSVFIDDKTRKEMYEQVVSLAKKVKYSSAGTVEFIMDRNKKFYFLEMNTRLQVEHCVTEYVTGLDLVEWMVRIAAGEKLSFKQKDVKLEGWAIESRIYAEDPSRGFLPSSGRINEYIEPKKSDKVRVDTGVYEGCEVSMFYDAMISKLSTYGKTRDEAIAQMQAALGSYVIRGISHNISFLEALVSHPRFGKGDLSTNFIAEEYPNGFSGTELTDERSAVFLCTAVFVFLRDAMRAAGVTDRLPGGDRQIGTRWVVTLEDEHFPVYIKEVKKGYQINCGGDKFLVESAWVIGDTLFKGKLNGQPFSVHIENMPGGFYLTHAGASLHARVFTPRVAELAKFVPSSRDTLHDNCIRAPITGKIVTLKVKEGDTIEQGQELLILEAMKMENVIYSEHSGTVAKILIEAGTSVNAEDIMMEFAPPEKEVVNG